MKSKMLIAAIAVAAGLSAPAVRAATPDSVEELMLLLKLDQQMAQMQSVIEESVETGFQQAVKQQGLSQEQIERLRPVLEAYRNNLAQALSWDSIKAELALIYQEELSDEEVEAIIVFYRSPEGQSLIAKLPVLMQRGAQVGQRRVEELMPEFQAQMSAAFERVRAEGGSEQAEAVPTPAVEQASD